MLRRCVYLETSRMGAPYIYDISHLRVNELMLITSRWLIVKYLVQNVSLKSHEFGAPILGPTLESAGDGL